MLTASRNSAEVLERVTISVHCGHVTVWKVFVPDRAPSPPPPPPRFIAELKRVAGSRSKEEVESVT